MSIISEALKKVEGSSSEPSGHRESPPAGPEGFDKRSPPPLFSVWSIVLSSAMVLIAAGLLLVTWNTNRVPTSDVPPAVEQLAAPPVAVVAVPAEDARSSALQEQEVGVAEDAARGAALQGSAVVAQATTEDAASGETAQAEVEVTEDTASGATLQEAAPEAEIVEEDTASGAVPEQEVAVAAEVVEPVETDPPAAVKPAEVKQVARPAEPARKRDELELTGVIYTPRVRMARINGKILPEGAKIRGYQIVTISRESVRLSKGGQFYLLRLKR